MGELQVTAARLVSVAQDLQVAAELARCGVGGLDDRLCDLLGSGWTGQAGSAFEGVWQGWYEGAQHLLVGLQEMATLLDEAAQAYHQADSAGASAVDSAGL